jgi:hypothetical protein
LPGRDHYRGQPTGSTCCKELPFIVIDSGDITAKVILTAHRSYQTFLTKGQTPPPPSDTAPLSSQLKQSASQGRYTLQYVSETVKGITQIFIKYFYKGTLWPPVSTKLSVLVEKFAAGVFYISGK